MEENILVILMAIVICLAIAFAYELYQSNIKRDEAEFLKRTNEYLEARYAQRDRESEKNFKELVGGIDGVTSVSLASKRYVELLKAENDLAELKEKVSNLDNK